MVAAWGVPELSVWETRDALQKNILQLKIIVNHLLLMESLHQKCQILRLQGFP